MNKPENPTTENDPDKEFASSNENPEEKPTAESSTVNQEDQKKTEPLGQCVKEEDITELIQEMMGVHDIKVYLEVTATTDDEDMFTYLFRIFQELNKEKGKTERLPKILIQLLNEDDFYSEFQLCKVTQGIIVEYYTKGAVTLTQDLWDTMGYDKEGDVHMKNLEKNQDP